MEITDIIIGLIIGLALALWEAWGLKQQRDRLQAERQNIMQCFNGGVRAVRVHQPGGIEDDYEVRFLGRFQT